MSNADIGKTMAQVLGLKIPFHGSLMGRVVEEALPGGSNPTVEQFVERAKPAKTASPPCWSASASADALFRRGRFPQPHRRHGRAQSRKPLIKSLILRLTLQSRRAE